MKKLNLFLASILCCLGVSAQNNLVFEPVLLTIDKADGLYAAGETVEVYGQLMGDTNYDWCARLKQMEKSFSGLLR